MDSRILDAISSLKFSLSSDEYERTRQALSYVESSFKSEKAETTRKLDIALKESNILTKQLEQYMRDHGELLLSNSESQHQLAESRTEFAHLRVRLAAADQEVQRLNNEIEVKFGSLSTEVKMLKKQNTHLSEENAGLEAAKAKIEVELRDCRLQCDNFKGKIKRLKEEMKEMEKKAKEVEKDRAKNAKIRMEKTKLERDYNSVMEAGSKRFTSFGERLSKLEQTVKNMMDNGSGSGSQLVDATQIVQEQESFGLEANCEGLVGAQSGHETTPVEEKTASSMPSPKATSATRVLAAPESFESDTRPGRPAGTQPVSETRVAEEKSASSTPCIHKNTFVDLCSSDDEGELPLLKVLKRKLPLSEVPLGIKTHTESISPSKKTMAVLKPCEQKVTDDHGESGNSKRNWDYEADLLDDLQKNAELCMKGFGALYRQQRLILYVHRATILAKFLTGGNSNGRLKKTLADLEKVYPNGADDCKKIAMAHSKQLFDIYKDGKNPL